MGGAELVVPGRFEGAIEVAQRLSVGPLISRRNGDDLHSNVLGRLVSSAVEPGEFHLLGRKLTPTRQLGRCGQPRQNRVNGSKCALATVEIQA